LTTTSWPPGRNPRILGTTLGLALCLLAVTAASSSAATTVLQGRFACNDGASLAGVRVELLKIYSRLLPEIPPNVRVAVATHADANGGWGFRVSGGETNWRVRAVLVNSDVGVKDFGIPWHHYADTLRTQNDRPLADYGTQIVPGAECRLWRAFKAAADGYRADTGGGHPAGTITVLDNAPTSGVPFSPYTDVFWPAGYSPTENVGTVAEPVFRSVAQHEFAHTVRHALDGDRAHFFFDTARFWYLRSHSGSSCDKTNHGFAFNEGWAEYWADEVRKTPCPNPNDFSIERNVAFELKRLQINQCLGVDRARMVSVLAQNRGRIHSMADFSNALGCVPRPVKRLGRATRPVSELLTLAAERVKEGRRFVASASATVGRARVALSQAHGSWAKTLAHGRLDQALALRKTFSYLASRAAQARIVRTSDRAQVSLILGKQRDYIRKLRAISVTTLRKGSSIFKGQGDAAAAQLLGEARASAQRGDVGVLQAVAMPLPSPSQAGPSPAGINVIDVGGAPPPPPPPPPPAMPPPVPPLPPLDLDLVIARVYGDDTTAENLCDILADVRNAGSAEAPATTTRFLSSQAGQFDQLIATPALAAGQTTTVRVAREYGDYNRATVTADAGNLIAETDETNNTGSGSGSPSTSAIGEENSARCRYP
jgi:hypothetical protein